MSLATILILLVAFFTLVTKIYSLNTNYKALKKENDKNNGLQNLYDLKINELKEVRKKHNEITQEFEEYKKTSEQRIRERETVINKLVNVNDFLITYNKDEALSVEKEDIVGLVTFDKETKKYAYLFGRILEINREQEYLIIENWTSSKDTYIREEEIPFEDIYNVYKCEEVLRI